MGGGGPLVGDFGPGGGPGRSRPGGSASNRRPDLGGTGWLGFGHPDWSGAARSARRRPGLGGVPPLGRSMGVPSVSAELFRRLANFEARAVRTEAHSRGPGAAPPHQGAHLSRGTPWRRAAPRRAEPAGSRRGGCRAERFPAPGRGPRGRAASSSQRRRRRRSPAQPNFFHFSAHPNFFLRPRARARVSVATGPQRPAPPPPPLRGTPRLAQN